MSHRLPFILALGFAATVAAGAFAVVAHRPAHEQHVDPSWGVFTDTQWRTLGSRLGANDLRVVAAMPLHDGTPFAIVTARRCLVVVRGTSPLRRVCGLTSPLLVFAQRDGSMTNVVGIASGRIEGVVSTSQIDGHSFTQGTALLRAPGARVFGSSFAGVPAFTARDRNGQFVARVRLYCASALRGVCGTSAQRRS